MPASTGVLQAFVVVPYITAVLALVWLAVLVRGPHVTPRFASKEIMRFSSVAWLATFTTQGLLWVDQLILPLYVSSAELAVYSVATSIVVLATFAMSPISQSLAPEWPTSPAAASCGGWPSPTRRRRAG